jgi:hypothetical protein
MSVELLSKPPPHWAATTRWPIQHPAMAEALRTMGYRPFYATDGHSAAIVQVRGGWPIVRNIVGRAYVYVSRETPEFLKSLLETLKARGYPYVLLGNITRPDALNGQSDQLQACHTFLIDTSQPPEQLWAAIHGKHKTAVRCAVKRGVTVREAGSPDDLDLLYPVLAGTSERILKKNHYTIWPREFFAAILERLVPTGEAVFYMAELEGQIIAVMLHLISSDTMLNYVSGSLREHAKDNAPSLLQWHAIEECHKRKLAWYDMGGCTPNLPEDDPGYGLFFFKKRWGGHLDQTYRAELYLSPRARALQETIRTKIWPYVQKTYFAMSGNRSRDGAGQPRA